ncbi:EpsI family protein [Sphingomonas piscis]|uniref:EpsI family protein n=1 Tax=Sphingomonas piscis TaxID=2714943 RepID=A0A6G7YQV0_9SPHN|nr:exosortase-associated protein EpsI, V-type [Sphingomonas piscis]QIK79113.1 EpsI family protein [Sphingomonas piscis]
MNFEPKLDRRKMLLSLALTASAGITFARQPRNKVDYLGSRKLERLIPTQIGDWRFATTSGLVVPPEDPLSDALYSQLLTRVYSDGINPDMMLLIAQSSAQTGLLQVHRPEFCYPAGGFQLSPIIQRQALIGGERTLTMNQLTASNPGRVERILYWTRVGNAMPISWAQQRLAIAVDNLKGRIPDAVLVRVSTVDADGPSAFTRLADFVEAMISGIQTADRRILVSDV